MAILTWRTLVLTFVATLSILASSPDSVQACCFSWLSGCFSGCGCDSCGAGYYGGGYYGGYAPTYDRCGSCGYGAGNYASAGAYGGGGCSSCGDGCGVTVPSNRTPVADPADDFRPGSGSDPGSPANNKGGGRRQPGSKPDNGFGGAPPAAKNTARSGSGGSGIDARTEGFPKHGRQNEPEGVPVTNDRDFQKPFGSKSNPDEAKDPFKAEKPAATEDKLPAEADEDPDAFPTDDDSKQPRTTNRPVLGEPSETDAPTPKNSVIPKKEAAPTDFPIDSETNEPADAEELDLDNKGSNSAVSPRTRLVLTSRFSSPSIARIRLRPSAQWVATPAETKLAKH